MGNDRDKIEHCLKLTLAVYRVTELFPEAGEDLKWQIRESANKILADLIYNNSENGSRHIEKIHGLFERVERQNWLDSRNFSVLKREYDKIQQIRPIRKNYGKTVENSSPKNNHRQKKILEAIDGNGKTKISELLRLFPEISRRTVLRDLGKLCQAGMMVRNGNGRGIYYTRNGQKCDMS